MKIAYLILAHKGYEQLVKLVNTLSNQTNDIFIHVDLKNTILYSQLEKEYTNNPQVKLIKDRISVNWSGLSQVEATLNLMNEVRKTTKTYDYISLISGQDFPIKSNVYINDFLSQNIGKEFIEYEDIGKHYWRLKCYNFFRENKNNRKLYMRIIDNLIRIPQKLVVRRKNLKDLNLYFGSQWFTITFDCMLYITNYLKNNPSFIDEFKYTACPDEHFFQVIILNSKYRDNVVNNNLKYIDWSRNKNSPSVLTIADYNKLKFSDKLFARKFDLTIDEEIINKFYLSNLEHN